MVVVLEMWQVCICELCGRRFWHTEEELCPTCHASMCPDCFRDYSACCVDPPRRPSKLERSEVRVIQALHASRQFTARNQQSRQGGRR